MKMNNLIGKYTIKVFRVLVYFSIVFVLLPGLFYFIVQLPVSQRYLTNKAEKYFEKTLHTKVSIKSIGLTLPKAIGIGGFYLEGQDHDTLAYFNRLEIDIDPFALFDHKIKVNSLKLDRSVCLLKRGNEDSVFNYDFILKSFEPSKPTGNGPEWTFEIDEFFLVDTRFDYQDLRDSLSLAAKVRSIKSNLNGYSFSKKLGNAVLQIGGIESHFITPAEHIQFSLKKQFIKFDHIDLNTSRLDVKELSLVEPAFFYENQKKVTRPQDSDIASFNITIPWRVTCAKLEIENASLRHDDLNYLNHHGFDAHHLDIKDLDISLKSVYLNQDGFASHLIALSGMEGDQFEVQHASTEFSISGSLLKFDNFKLITPNSNFEGGVQVGYSNIGQLITLSGDTQIKHRLDEGKLGSEDLLYFLPAIHNSETPIQALNSLSFQWNLTGSLSDIKINNLQIYDNGKPTSTLGGRIQHLINPDSIAFDVEFEVNNHLFQRFKPYHPKMIEKIKLPTQMGLKSRLSGNPKNFSFNNTLYTDKGTIRLTGSYQDLDVLDYHVNVELGKLDLGYLLCQPAFRTIDMKVEVIGKGKELGQGETSFTGGIGQLYFNGYPYRDINVSGNFKNKIGDLKLKIQDPNLQAEIFSTIDFTQELAQTVVDMSVTKAQFQNLGLTSEDVQTSGSVSFDIKGTSMDSLDVKILTEDARVTKNGLVYETSPSSIKVRLGKNMSYINADFPFLKSYFKSNFPISNLQHVLVQEMIPTLLSDSISSIENDHEFEFGITQFKQKILSNLLVPELKSLELTDFKGFYKGQSKEVGLLVDIPNMTYQNMQFDSLYVKANENNPGFNFSGFLKKLTVGKFASHSIVAMGNASKGVANVSIDLLDSLANKSLSVSAKIYPLDSVYKISIVKDSVLLGYERWAINENNQLILGPKGLNIQGFSLMKKNEAFNIYSKDTVGNMPIHANFKQFDLGFISKLMGSSQKQFSGNLNGEILLYNVSSEFAFESDLFVQHFTYSNDELGDVRLITKKISEDKYDIGFEVNGEHTTINGSGYYLSATDSVKMNLVLKEFDISTMDGFSSTYLQNLKGQLTGNLEIIGLMSRPSLDGKLNFHNVSFNTVYLGSFYNFKDEFIELKDDKIHFDQFKIYDKKENLAIINGFVGSSDLESYIFNLNLSTNKFELLNTKATGGKDELFYGNLIISSDVKVRGNSTKPMIDANAKVIGGSELTIVVPKAQTETIEHEGIVKFISQDSTLLQVDSINTNRAELVGVSLQSNLEVLPEAKLKIIIDPDAGDFLEVKGKSTMSYTIDPTGTANLSGTYEVSEGVYNLTFYNFLKKQFLLKKGSKISWTGDPYDARLDASASYTVNTSPLPLIESQLTTSDQSSRTAYQQILPFIVSLNIGGEISNPQIQFGIELPIDKQNFQGGVVNGKIQQLNTQESELNKQVFSLLLFNRFLPENSFSGGASGALSSTARNSVSKLLTQQLNGLTGKYIKGIRVHTDVESFEDYSTGSARGRTDLKLELSKELFNEKLVVKVGSNVVLEGDQKQSGARNLAQDIVLEYKLDEDGSYRLKAFRKNQYEGIIDGELTKTGIGMTLSREFETWEDLLLVLKPTKKK